MSHREQIAPALRGILSSQDLPCTLTSDEVAEASGLSRRRVQLFGRRVSRLIVERGPEAPDASCRYLGGGQWVAEEVLPGMKERPRRKGGKPPRGTGTAVRLSIRFSMQERAYLARAMPGGTWSPAAARSLALSAPQAPPVGLPDFSAKVHRDNTSVGLTREEVDALTERVQEGEEFRVAFRRLALWGAAQVLAETTKATEED